MARVTKVVIDGVEHKVADVGGTVVVHVHDGEIDRELEFSSNGASEKIRSEGVAVGGSTEDYGDLFGNEEADFAEEDDDEDDDEGETYWCDDCDEHIEDCTCFDDDDDDDDFGDDPHGEPWEDDDIVSLNEDLAAPLEDRDGELMKVTGECDVAAMSRDFRVVDDELNPPNASDMPF